MGIFAKRERTHIGRDEEGRAVLTREEEPHGVAAVKETFRRRPVSEELTYEEQFPQEIQPKYVRQRRKEKLISAGKKTNSWIDRNIQPIGGYPSKSRTRRPRTGQRYSTKNNFNPFGSMFDNGVTPMRKPRQANYAIVEGKAYPIARKKKKRKKAHRKIQNTRPTMDFDPFDNWEFW